MAAVGVAMVGVAASTDARRQSTIVRLTRLRQQIGVGLHSADSVRVPIWLSLLLVVIYIALGAVMFSMWESVGIASESTSLLVHSSYDAYTVCRLVRKLKTEEAGPQERSQGPCSSTTNTISGVLSCCNHG